MVQMKLESILKKCTEGDTNDTKFDLTTILEPEKVTNIAPVLPSEKNSLKYIFKPTGFTEIKYNSNNDNEIIVGAFNLLNPTCYYHWMVNDFPRYFMCYSAGARLFINSCGRRPVPCLLDQLVDPHLGLGPQTKFISESLSLFKDKVRFIDIKECVKAFSDYSIKIIYPYLPDELQGISDNRKITNYAKKIIPRHFNINMNNAPKHKIRITRKDDREIRNSSTVDDYLKNEGFQIVALEELGVREQLQLIADSQIVFATHGSGITNCTVLSKSALIIEVCPENFYIKNEKRPYCNVPLKYASRNQFHILSEIVGCKYEYLMSNKDGSINIDDIKKCLNRYLHDNRGNSDKV